MKKALLDYVNWDWTLGVVLSLLIAALFFRAWEAL